MKTITVITPPLDKHDVAEVETLSLQSNAELTAYKKESHGSLYFGANLDQLVMRIQQLSDGDVCRLDCGRATRSANSPANSQGLGGPTSC